MKKHLISIIIPVHNAEEDVLIECIMGALNQNYKNKEIIIVDDFSDEKTKKILKKIKKNYKIRIIENRENKGLAYSLNKGILNSKGEYIITLLQDCVPYSKNWLAELVELANKRKDVVAICSRVKDDYETWKKQDKLIKDLVKDKKGDFRKPFLDEKGCLYKKRFLEKVGLFDEKNFIFAGEDYDMYQKLSKQGVILHGIKPYVIHKHFYNLEKIKWTTSIYGRSFGRLFRIYNKEIKGWFKGVVIRNLFPFWGILKGIKTNPKKLKVIITYIELNWIYSVNFLKGYFKKEQ